MEIFGHIQKHCFHIGNGKMKRVITYGTFDMLHYGHINLLKRAKSLGDYLIVALSTDEFNLYEKKKKCYFHMKEKTATRSYSLCRFSYSRE